MSGFTGVGVTVGFGVATAEEVPSPPPAGDMPLSGGRVLMSSVGGNDVPVGEGSTTRGANVGNASSEPLQPISNSKTNMLKLKAFRF
ncbi:MAG: hypothetical protein DHS20C20_12140 [Ardenticatenaceae bacterium]|nr:MAG: hypothetical protein DHS20C20_12140 [Ardenticatenaceae bacterium]